MGDPGRKTLLPTTIPEEMTLNELVERWPDAHAALTSLGLDTCCGGSLTLTEAARRHGLSMRTIEERLAEVR